MRFEVNKIRFILGNNVIEDGVEILITGVNYDRVKGYTCKGKKIFKERF